MKEPNPSRARIVFFKEMKETFRDRRVLLSVIVSPLLITPLLLAVMGFFVGQKTTRDQAEVLDVAAIGSLQLPALLEEIESDPTLRVIDLDPNTGVEDAVRSRVIRAALVIPDSAGTNLESEGTVKIDLFYDASNEKSSIARGRLHQALNQFRKGVLASRLTDHDLKAGFLEPTRIEDQNLATEKATGGFILGIILPYVVILTASMGGVTSALDLIAGEKEKGTLETLLVSPASRKEIIVGKLGTVCVVSVLAGLCAIAGLIATLEIGVRLTADLIPIGIAISYASVAAMLLAIIPLTLTTSALLLVISAFARNPKEAQAYIFPFMIVVILPAMLSFVLPAEGGQFLSLVPILNTAMVMKQVLSDMIRPDFIALATISSLVYAGLALRLVVALFQKESILFRI
ncbi:MAG: ABC transporter permease [Opitutaceae bacterium]